MTSIQIIINFWQNTMDCSLLPESMLKIFQERIMKEYPDKPNPSNQPPSPVNEKKREKKIARVIEISEPDDEGDFKEPRNENQVKEQKIGKEPPKKLCKFPKVYLINNLLKLSKEIKFEQLEKYMLLQGYKTNIPYSRILLCFGIEKLIHLFYQQHSLNIKINEKYAFQQIDRNLIKFLDHFKIRDRLLLSKVVSGACRRFGSIKYFSEKWLTNKLSIKRKILESFGVKVSKLIGIEDRKTLEDNEDYPYMPDSKDLFKNQFNYQEKYPSLALEYDGQEELENPEEFHKKKQLFFWKNYEDIPEQEEREESQEEDLEQEEEVLIEKEEKKFEKPKTIEPEQIKFKVVIKASKIRKAQKIHRSLEKQIIEESEEQDSFFMDGGKDMDEIQEVPKPETKVKKQYMTKKKEAKMKKLKEIQNEKEKEEEKFRIKVTPQQIKYIISKVDKAIKNMFEKLANDLKMKEQDVEFIYTKKKDYINILESGKKSLMRANSIVIEKEETEGKNKGDVIDQETLCNFLNVQMKKFLVKTKDSDIRVVWNECERILSSMNIPKNQRKSIVKKWVERLKKSKF